MKKGSLLFNAFFLISVLAMAYVILEIGVTDEQTLISLGTLGVVAIVIFGAYITGVNKLAHMKVALKQVRKKILDAHVKDPEYVWEWLCKEKFLFKNSSLDGQFNNYKKEMSRLENEGAVYCQADVKDYINLDTICSAVKKSLLDSVALIVAMVGMVGVLLQVGYDLKNYPFTVSLFVEDTLMHILAILVCTFVLLIQYVYVYKVTMSRVANECNLFTGDFHKYVVPTAKNDMVNNVLYLQQLQIETLTNTLNRFNEGVDELAYSIKDILESGTATSVENIKAMTACLEKLEKAVEKSNALEEKEVKKITRKKATTTKTTKAKDTTKTATKSKKAKEEEVKAEEAKEEEVKEEEVKAEEAKAEEVVVEVAPVKKKRGRKSKAEKEAELKAAIANAIKEAEVKPKKSTRGRKKKTEEVVEEKVAEVVEDTAEEKVAEVVEEATEEKVAEVVEEATEEKVAEAVEDTAEEKVVETVEDTAEEKVAEVVEDTAEEKVAEVVEEATEEKVAEAVEDTTEDK